jgi:hypothetical protein
MKLFAQATRLSLALLAGLLLSSCGGGDPYAGLWKGTIDGNREANAIVLGDGTYYMVYSKPGDPTQLAGVLQGTGDFHGATFTASNGRDYSWEGFGAQNAPVSGRIGARQSVSGSVSSAIRPSRSFSLSYKRDLDDDARLEELAGSFAGTAWFILGPRPGVVFTVTKEGAVSSVINGCHIAGTARPRSDANAFDLTLSFTHPVCAAALGRTPYVGVVLFHPDERRLEAALVNDPARVVQGQAIVFNGIRQ